MSSKSWIAGLLTIAALLLTAVLALAASAVDPASTGRRIAAPVDTNTPVPSPTPALTPIPVVASAWAGWDPADGRINPDPAAPLAIYCGTDSIEAYVPGAVEFSFPLEAGAVSGFALLAEGPTGARLYRLSTGEFQVNMQHGNEEYVFTWDTCWPNVTTTRVYDMATGALLSEFTRQP